MPLFYSKYLQPYITILSCMSNNTNKEINLFYHVSKIDHGEVFTFKPRLPSSALVNNEGNIPRVCVCTEIFYCLRAITSGEYLRISHLVAELQRNDPVKDYGSEVMNIAEVRYQPPAIYATEEQPFIPPNASDFRRNKEHWFLSEVAMERIGYLDLESFYKGTVAVIKDPVTAGVPLCSGMDIISDLRFDGDLFARGSDVFQE